MSTSAEGSIVRPAPNVDAVPMMHGHRTDPIRLRLDDLLTRSFYSGPGYVFESEPWVVPEDDALLQAFAEIRDQDRRHAHVLGVLIQQRGGVPQPGVFPWWNLDLNYLSVPTLAKFVLEALDEEITLYGELIGRWPSDDPAGRAR